MDDNNIINLFWKRDENAIAETDEKYRGFITKILSSYLDNKADQEECLDDIYLKLWNNIPPTRPINLSAYIAKITKNHAMNKVKEKGRIKRGGHILLATLDELEEICGKDTTEEHMAVSELTHVIEDFLREQSELDRFVFVRRYWATETVADIADRYDLSKISVNVRLHRMRNKLKKYLSERGML